METPSAWWKNNVTGAPPADPISQAQLRKVMEDVWKACMNYGMRPDYVVLPSVWFDRVPVRRVGRRLFKGRWRIKPRLMPKFRQYFGLMPSVRDAGIA